MTTQLNKSIRLDPSLMQMAAQIGGIMRRSIPKQIEYWAELGRMVEDTLDKNSVLDVLQGFKTLKLEDVSSEPIDSEKVFSDVSRVSSGKQSHAPLTTAEFYYEESTSRPGYLDRVNSRTNERQTGKFQNGKFEVLP